jgi:hypothetical protein
VKNLRMVLFACFICLCCVRASMAQALYGSTSIDIDPDTGAVTATCETDTDSYTDAYYSAEVYCVVEDSNNNAIASGLSTDTAGQGYAQVVLTFTGVPGTTYIATGTHEVKITYRVEVDDPPQPIFLGYDDVYNFGFFSENPQTYDDFYEWDGLGPETGTRSSIQRTGNTKATAVDIKIVFTGQNTALNDTTQSAVVGQQIALTASYSLPAGITVQSQSWSVPGTTVGGYSASASSGATIATNFSQPSTTFYWVDTGTARNVVYNLTLSDGSTWSASVPFNVSGPTSTTMTAVLGPVNIVSGPRLEFGNSGTPGIEFTAGTTPPTGTTGQFLFVQIVTAYNVSYSTGCQFSTGTGLDNVYPLPFDSSSNNSTNDSPSIALFSVDSEGFANFSATTYLLWQPNVTNSIPVPLGNISWQWSGDAVQIGSSGVFSLNTSNKNASAFSPSISFPTWTTRVVNGYQPCQ